MIDDDDDEPEDLTTKQTTANVISMFVCTCSAMLHIETEARKWFSLSCVCVPPLLLLLCVCVSKAFHIRSKWASKSGPIRSCPAVHRISSHLALALEYVHTNTQTHKHTHTHTEYRVELEWQALLSVCSICQGIIKHPVPVRKERKAKHQHKKKKEEIFISFAESLQYGIELNCPKSLIGSFPLFSLSRLVFKQKRTLFNRSPCSLHSSSVSNEMMMKTASRSIAYPCPRNE